MNSLNEGCLPQGTEAIKASNLPGRVELIKWGARYCSAKIVFASAGARGIGAGFDVEQGHQTAGKNLPFGGFAPWMRLDAADEAVWEHALTGVELAVDGGFTAI